MEQTPTGKRKGRQSKAFNPKRDFLNEAVKDYLRRGGKITKIIDETEGYERMVNISEEMPSGGTLINY
jgi:hypothetical protein